MRMTGRKREAIAARLFCARERILKRELFAPVHHVLVRKPILRPNRSPPAPDTPA